MSFMSASVQYSFIKSELDKSIYKDLGAFLIYQMKKKQSESVVSSFFFAVIYYFNGRRILRYLSLFAVLLRDWTGYMSISDVAKTEKTYQPKIAILK